MNQTVIPAVLLRALSEYKFVGHPLWRMADGKDHVRVELAFHKNLPTQPIFKKRAESRRQPAPSAGEWPRQPTAARRPPPTRSSPTVQPTVRREAPEKETSPPALEDTQKVQGWGHPLGSWVRTLSRQQSEDTLSALGWGHPLLGFWVRTPTWLLGEDTHLAPFPATDRWHVAFVRNFRTTRADCLMHFAVGIDKH